MWFKVQRLQPARIQRIYHNINFHAHISHLMVHCVLLNVLVFSLYLLMSLCVSSLLSVFLLCSAYHFAYHLRHFYHLLSLECMASYIKRLGVIKLTTMIVDIKAGKDDSSKLIMIICTLDLITQGFLLTWNLSSVTHLSLNEIWVNSKLDQIHQT
ncbi:hypothetical protein BDR06DRAFT_977444 [Suillus hirtellus]|nr:hypothetical protein BDR06DRAFT_977444 [Suillus hirtellus]